MRSLSITALMILAAFALGLTLGGRMPGEAAAQDESNGVAWEHDGAGLALYNQTRDQAFLVTGAYKPGAVVLAPPWYSTGMIKLSASNLDKVVVYKLQPELACSPIECRRCDEGALCPTPDWPPIHGAKEVRSLIDYR